MLAVRERVLDGTGHLQRVWHGCFGQDGGCGDERVTRRRHFELNLCQRITYGHAMGEVLGRPLGVRPAQRRDLRHLFGQPAPAPRVDFVDVWGVEMVEPLHLPVWLVYQAPVEELAQGVVHRRDGSSGQFLEREALQIPILRQTSQDGLVGRCEAPGGVFEVLLGGEAVTARHGSILAA